jgi:enoyl-CoA hydratase/carnithine racemase
MELLLEFDKPVIAAADGAGVGIGLTFLLHCDFVYVSDRVRLRAPFVRLGVVPEAGSSVLFPLVLGWRNAAEVIFGAEFIDGPRAVALGIANACVAPEALLETAGAPRALARQAPLVQASKRLLPTRAVTWCAPAWRENAAFARLPATLSPWRPSAPSPRRTQLRRHGRVEQAPQHAQRAEGERSPGSPSFLRGVRPRPLRREAAA